MWWPTSWSLQSFRVGKVRSSCGQPENVQIYGWRSKKTWRLRYWVELEFPELLGVHLFEKYWGFLDMLLIIQDVSNYEERL